MSIAVNASLVRSLRTVRRPDWLVSVAAATGGLSAIVIALELVQPVHVIEPERSRRARDRDHALGDLHRPATRGELPGQRPVARFDAPVRPCGVSLTDFAYCAVPALADGARPEAGGGARLCCSLIVSIAFAAAAFAPSKVIRYPGPRAIGGAILAGATIVLLSQFIEQATGSHWNATLQDVGIRGAIQRPVALTVQLLAAALLVVSALAFLRRGRRGDFRCGLLAAAAFLLAVARLQYLALPAVATDWITPREGLRVAAYALLLGSAYWEYALRRRARALAAISQSVSGSPATCTTGLRRIWRVSPHKGNDSAPSWNLGILLWSLLATPSPPRADDRGPVGFDCSHHRSRASHHRRRTPAPLRFADRGPDRDAGRSIGGRRPRSGGARAGRTHRSRGNGQRGDARRGPPCRRSRAVQGGEIFS